MVYIPFNIIIKLWHIADVNKKYLCVKKIISCGKFDNIDNVILQYNIYIYTKCNIYCITLSEKWYMDFGNNI